MLRFSCVIFALALSGCAQNVTPFALNGSQSTGPNAGAATVKPNDEVVAHVTFKDKDSASGTEFTIFVSYDKEPWFVSSRQCLRPGDTTETDVYYREPNKVQQIKFSAEKAASFPWHCSPFRSGHRTVAFHSIVFKGGSANFHVTYDVDRAKQLYTLCAEGGGWNRICDKG